MATQIPYNRIEVCRTEYEQNKKVVDIQMKNFEMSYELWQKWPPNLGAIDGMIQALEKLKPVIERYHDVTVIDEC